jgi:hypothetical protein
MTDNSRDRAFSASTASTATPPKLLDADLAFSDGDTDGFGDMFDNIGKRESGNIRPKQGVSQNV